MYIILRAVQRVRPVHHAARVLQSVDLRHHRVLGTGGYTVRTSPYSSVATVGGGMGARPPSPSRARSWELLKSEEKKIGGGVGVPDHLGQTDFAEICVLVMKYISKLNKIQNTNFTCHVFNYIFQMLVFKLLDNSANKHAEQPRFSHASLAAHAL